MVASQSSIDTAVLRTALKSQYHASLAMFRQAVELCPDTIWAGGDYLNPCWRIAYHTLYFVHLYIQPSARDFRAWEHHQTGIQDMDDVPAPPDIQDMTEPAHRPPQTGKPYTKEQILEYWSICDRMIDGAVDAFDITAPESGFPWYPISKFEHQIVAIRHIQHHTAQLADRVRTSTNQGVDWMGRFRKAELQPGG